MFDGGARGRTVRGNRIGGDYSLGSALGVDRPRSARGSRGHAPRRSGARRRQAERQGKEQGCLRTARRQPDADAGGVFDDAGGDFEQAIADRPELRLGERVRRVDPTLYSLSSCLRMESKSRRCSGVVFG